MSDIKAVLEAMLSAAVGAGEIIMRYYNGSYEAWNKEDKTPVTSADLASSEFIMSTLRTAYPDFGMLCEESADETDSDGNIVRLRKKHCFIIDPIDGTKSFIRRTGQFAVSIALAEDHQNIAGVIYAPAYGTLYYAAKGYGAYKACVNTLSDVPIPFDGERLKASDRTSSLIAVQSDPKSDPDAEEFLSQNLDRVDKIIRLGGCLKGCAIAEGRADIHYKFAGYTKEWDTAAEEVICLEAGALVTDAYGNKLTANRKDFVNRRGIRILNTPASALGDPCDNI